MRSGFSPSLVRKLIQRDRMLPAMWRIRIATLLASGSIVDVQLLVGQLRDRFVGELLDLLQLVDGGGE